MPTTRRGPSDGRTKLGARDIGVSHWRYAPGFRSPMGHHHREQEEAYVVVAGSGRILLDGDVHEPALDVQHFSALRK